MFCVKKLISLHTGLQIGQFFCGTLTQYIFSLVWDVGVSRACVFSVTCDLEQKPTHDVWRWRWRKQAPETTWRRWKVGRCDPSERCFHGWVEWAEIRSTEQLRYRMDGLFPQISFKDICVTKPRSFHVYQVVLDTENLAELVNRASRGGRISAKTPNFWVFWVSMAEFGRNSESF